MPACPTCGQDNPPRAKFCLECGSPMPAESADASAGARKTVTVLFADVTGSTSLGERLDAESLRHVMDRYFERMRMAVERHGGTVEKFIGDAVMAVFGIPTVHEDDALRAVRAAQEMGAALAALNDDLDREWGVRLAMRVGINTGEIVTGRAAASAGGQRLVVGDPVNVAARLEQAAAPGEILLGDETLRLVRNAVVTEDLPEPLALKGKAEPVAAHRLVSVDPDATGTARRLDSPMVGRERQLTMLRQAFDATRQDRACHLFTILAPAGVGKSRLVLEFLRSMPVDALVLRGRCLSYGEGITFWPVVDVIRQAAGIADDDDQEELRTKVAALVSGIERADVVARRIAELLGVEEPSGSPEEVFWAVRRVFESLAAERPLVLVFDDIHWAEPTLLDLIEHIADWTKDAPILLVCPARPELLDVRPAWGGGKFNATSILLEPLPEADCERLIDQLIGSADLPADVRRRIAEAAEGTPLFVEEMLAMLMDEGRLRRDPVTGAWVPSGDLSRIAVPPGIHALLAARLDQLPPDERSILECGSVEGKVFHRGAVVALAPEGLRGKLDGLLRSLLRKELLRADRAEIAGEDAFRFRHQLIRDAAYQGMPKERRSTMHDAFARWLEGRGHGMHEYEEILGYHLEQAYRLRAELGPMDDAGRELGAGAARALLSAGHRANARGDASGMVNLLERARALLPRGDRDRLLQVPLIVSALIDLGEIARARAMCEEAFLEASAAGDPAVTMRMRVQRALVLGYLEPDWYMAEVPGLIEEALQVFEPLGDHAGLAAVWELESGRLNQIGHPPEMYEVQQRALEHARAAGDRRSELEKLLWLAATTFWGTTPADEGIRRLEATLDEVRGDRFAEQNVSRVLSGFLAMQGRFDEARALLNQSRAAFEELGLATWLLTDAFFRGPIELWAGNPEEAFRAFRESVEGLEETGERAWSCSLAAFAGEALYVLDRLEEAEEWTNRAEASAGKSDLEAQADIRSVRAKILARRGRLEEAERLAVEAVEISNQTYETDHIGDSLFDLAEVLRIAGRREDAADALRKAVEQWDQKGNLVSAAKGRAVLEELGEEESL